MTWAVRCRKFIDIAAKAGFTFFLICSSDIRLVLYVAMEATGGHVCSRRQVVGVAERAETCHAACLESSGEYL